VKRDVADDCVVHVPGPDEGEVAIAIVPAPPAIQIGVARVKGAYTTAYAAVVKPRVDAFVNVVLLI
jgi:hypothetical protein